MQLTKKGSAGNPAAKSSQRGWHFFVDRGGTFTDVVALTPDARIRTLKLLSEDPDRYADAALEGMQRLLASAPDMGRELISVRMGTTVGTNALLEHRGAPTALVITRGFADLLRIGSQQRPDIFALDIRLPEPLYTMVIEVSERIAADGTIIEALDETALIADLARARDAGIETVAIALVNAYRNPGHESLAAKLAREAGFGHVSASSEVTPDIGIVERGQTAVVDAYLTPILESYKSGLRDGLAGQGSGDVLWFMQSHGGLIDAAGFRGCDCVLSGPAGGVVGMARTAASAGFDAVIGFDMGGTSTDVSLFAGQFERTAATTIAGVPVTRPMLQIHTVAAGGGSLLEFRGGRLQVGPESAGADPGPACYRRGGPLTLTDANLALGRIQANYFPAVFGASGGEPVDTEAVHAGFGRLADKIRQEAGYEMPAFELAAGFVRIAVANMAQAIEQISIQRGHDARDFAMSCFGGAGGQHACAVADALGIRTILIHPLSGVLSAYGIGLAERRSIESAGIHARLDTNSVARARSEVARLADRLLRGFDDHARIEARALLRDAGSDTVLAVAFPNEAALTGLVDAFRAEHRRRFGFSGNDDIVLQAIEVEAIAGLAIPGSWQASGGGTQNTPCDRRRIWFDGQWVDTPIYRRDELVSDVSVAGPAMIIEDNATVIVEVCWQAQMDSSGMLIIRRIRIKGPEENVSTETDPVLLEIFGNQFMHVAEQMGAVLQQTAHSVNIKERLDYSCALFDRAGALIANAPHVPVHLGSMGDSVREVIRSANDLKRGDAFMLNAPYRGGTHLPDITVVAPVFSEGSSRPDFFVASRAHHADVGGTSPGSMPALSQSIAEEGVLIEPARILSEGVLLEDEILAVLTAGPYPARNPRQNIADLKAQLAANARGINEIARLISRYGNPVVESCMQHVRDNAEACTRRALMRLEGGSFETLLDSGERIAVAISIDRNDGTARIDFTGSSGMSGGNLNAPRSVVNAVVLYVLRALVKENIPLNAGCLVPVELIVPSESLLDPRPPAAVAGGNVETSQVIADALLAAFGVTAASQGTMNNLTFGDATHQYYETICGGTGAGADFDGASAVHSHMTNSRLTDVEVLEQRLPVRVHRFAIRTGSGGSGRRHGGDGVVREIGFLAPMQVSLLANRRRQAPFGLAGGQPGLPGRDTLVRANGVTERIPPAAEFTVEPGDRLVIETPGGGGYGEKGSDPIQVSPK